MKKGSNLAFGCISFLSISAKNQAPHVSIGMGPLIYQTKALSVVIRTILRNFQKVVPVSRTGLKFLNLVQVLASKAIE